MAYKFQNRESAKFGQGLFELRELRSTRCASMPGPPRGAGRGEACRQFLRVFRNGPGLLCNTAQPASREAEARQQLKKLFGD